MERPPFGSAITVEKPKSPERLFLEDIYRGLDLDALFDPDIERSYRSVDTERRETVREILTQYNPNIPRSFEEEAVVAREFLEACRSRDLIDDDYVENSKRYFMSMKRNATNGVLHRMRIKRGEESVVYRHPVDFDIASTVVLYHTQMMKGEALLGEAKERMRKVLQLADSHPHMPEKHCWWIVDAVTLHKARKFLRRIRSPRNIRSTSFLRMGGIYDFGPSILDMDRYLLGETFRPYGMAPNTSPVYRAVLKEFGPAVRANEWLFFGAACYAQFRALSDERRRRQVGEEVLNPFEPILHSWINGTPIIGCDVKKQAITIPSACLVSESR